MNQVIFLKALLTWIVFVPVAILNGALRQLWYQKFTGELLGHQISTFTGSIAFLVLAYFMMQRVFSGLPSGQLILIGFLWLVLTLIFEFGMGLLGGRSWSYILADYNLAKGRVWVLFLLLIFFAPLILGHLPKFRL